MNIAENVSTVGGVASTVGLRLDSVLPVSREERFSSPLWRIRPSGPGALEGRANAVRNASSRLSCLVTRACGLRGVVYDVPRHGPDLAQQRRCAIRWRAKKQSRWGIVPSRPTHIATLADDQRSSVNALVRLK